MTVHQSGAGGFLVRQYDMAWALASYHFESLTTEECLWRPADMGLHVCQGADGKWRADWPEHEGYDIGPASIGWLTWHLGFWLAMLLDQTCKQGTLQREEVVWPGSAEAVKAWIGGMQQEWRAVIEGLSDGELADRERGKWPFQGKPFGDVVAWANFELVKNVAEIGYARFCYGRRHGGQRGTEK